MAQITDNQLRRNRTQRVQIALVGLLAVGFAVFVTGSLMNRSGSGVANNQTAAEQAAASSNQSGRDDPLADIGAAPVAEPSKDEDVPGTGATVNQVTGNVSDMPAPQRR